MATYAEITAKSAGYQHKMAVAIASQDTSANTTTLNYTYDIYYSGKASDGGWTTLHNVTFSVTIAGNTYTSTPNFDFRANRYFAVRSTSITVPNNSDGSLTVNFGFSASALPGSVQFQARAASGSIVVTPIPRRSTFTLSPNPVFVGNSVDIHIDRSVGTFKHQIVRTVDGVHTEIANNVDTDYTWTPPDLLGGGSQKTFQVTVHTYNGATLVGSAATDVTQVAVPTYPVIGKGTPYDIRLRRVEVQSGSLVPTTIIPFLEATATDTLSATGALTFTVSKKLYATDLHEKVVIVQFFDGANWLSHNQLYYVSRSEGDKTDMADTVSYTGLSYADYLLSKNLITDNYEWPPTTPGNVIWTYMVQGKQRGWGPHMETSATRDYTSVGTPWVGTTDLGQQTSTPLLQLLEGFVNDVLMEYRSYLNGAGDCVVEMFNPGFGSDWTVRGALPMVNLATAALFKNVDKAPVRKDAADKLTRVWVQGDESARGIRERSDTVNPLLGHLEGGVAATGVKDQARLNELGDALLADSATATVERTFTYDLSSTQTSPALYPYRTFRPGDWILVPGDDAPIRARVSQIAITRDADGTTATVTIGDLIPNGVAATARKLSNRSSGAIAGGTQGTPLPLSSAIPAAPTGVVAVIDGYWDNSGAPKSGVTLTWSPVTGSLSGNALQVDAYEVYRRAEAGDPWDLVAITQDPTTTNAPLDINKQYEYTVRARGTNGNFSPYSDTVPVTTIEPDETLAAPSTPILSVDALGTISVAWNGQIGGTTPPPWFNYVIAEISSTSGGAYTVAGQQLQQAGSITVPDAGEGTWWFRLVGYDTLNKRGAVSGTASVVVVPLAIDTREPKAPTDVVVTSEGYWNGADAESLIHVEWDAVTEGIDNDPITVPLYEVWGKLSTDTTPHLLGITADTQITVTPIGPIGSVWNIGVRAQAANRVFSGFSSTHNVTIAAPTMALLEPTQPSLNSLKGIVQVSWDGKLTNPGDPMDDSDDIVVDAPDFLSNVDIEVSLDGGTNWQVVGFLTRGTRTQSVSGFAVGQEVHVRLRAYDILGQQSDPSVETTVVVVGIDGGDILAGSIQANKIEAGSLTVNEVSPSFGSDLNISANGTVSIISGQVSAAQADADANADSIAALRTRYDFTPTEAVISQPGSPFQVSISNTQMEFRESGVARAYLNAGVFNAPRMASQHLVLTYHVIEDDPDGTVMRRL